MHSVCPLSQGMLKEDPADVFCAADDRRSLLQRCRDVAPEMHAAASQALPQLCGRETGFGLSEPPCSIANRDVNTESSLGGNRHPPNHSSGPSMSSAQLKVGPPQPRRRQSLPRIVIESCAVVAQGIVCPEDAYGTASICLFPMLTQLWLPSLGNARLKWDCFLFGTVFVAFGTVLR